MKKLINTLNLRDFIDLDSPKCRFVKDLKEEFGNTGFFFLKNHGISEDTLNTATNLFQKFFQLNVREKLQYEHPELHHQVGYTPFGVEKGEYAKVADKKQFYQVGDQYEFPLVKEVGGLKECSEKLFYAFEKTYRILLQATALSLNLPEAYFNYKIGNSIMRAIDYPAHDNPMADDGEVAKGGNILGMCASKHTDINMITLLFAKEPGLELWHENSWQPVVIPDPNVIVVNCGDMLESLTGGRYKSGMHRVVCEKNKQRSSFPFFGHVNENEMIAPLPSIGESDLKRFPFQTAGEFLHHRLQQIGLSQ